MIQDKLSLSLIYKMLMMQNKNLSLFLLKISKKKKERKEPFVIVCIGISFNQIFDSFPVLLDGCVIACRTWRLFIVFFRVSGFIVSVHNIHCFLGIFALKKCGKGLLKWRMFCLFRKFIHFIEPFIRFNCCDCFFWLG